MEHKLYFSGDVIDLAQSVTEIENSFKTALGHWYPTLQVAFDYYKEIDSKTIEFSVKRNYYKNSVVMSGIEGCISSGDMEIIASISEKDIRPENKLGIHLFPWYNGLYYTPIEEFIQIWAYSNELKANEKIDKVKIVPGIDELTISVIFK